MGNSPSIADAVGDGSSNNWTTGLTVLYLTGGLSVILVACRTILLIGETACCCIKCCTCLTKRCSCCKDGKDKGYPHGSGRTQSLLLMILSMLIALLWQWHWAQPMINYADRRNPDSVGAAWHAGGCVDGAPSYPTCIDYGASLRVSFAQFIFFVVMAGMSAAQPTLHDLGWDVKWVLFLVMVIGFIWAPGTAFDLGGYAWIARICGFVFVVLQQLIMIDGAHAFNYYMTYAGSGGTNEITATMKILILLIVLLYIVSFVGWVLMYVYFTDAQQDKASTAFVSVTLAYTVIFTTLQLFSDPDLGHNLFTSAVVACYSTYLTYVAVSSNPNTTNPATSTVDGDGLGVMLGLGISFVALAATVYFSSTSVTEAVSSSSSGPRKAVLADVLTGGDGTNVGSSKTTPGGGGGDDEEVGAAGGGRSKGSLDYVNEFDTDGGIAWRFNLVMALISCYWCMVVTNWAKDDDGAIRSGASTGGSGVMWLNAVASWICMSLYTWTLAAPRLFPNRDFT